MRCLAASDSLPSMRSLITSLLFATSAAYAQEAGDATDIPTDGEVREVIPSGTELDVTAPPIVTFGGPETLLVEVGEEQHMFSVEIAETSEQLAQGLMYREALAADAGMLFFYAPPRATSMWMENTLIPLDIVFIDSQGVVVKVTGFAQPGSRRSLTSDFPVAGVLELAGGRAIELGIRPGSVVRHAFFDNFEGVTEGEIAANDSAEDTE